MFAGAAREAVFSKAEVVRRVNADFVPVALKAALVNNPPGDEEGRLYREIGRSKPAPQGICVVNSAGKVLDWVLMFDDDKSVLAFLDHVSKRFAKYPNAKRPVPAERYMKFPSAKLEDVEDSGQVLPISEGHAKGKHCPAQPPLPEGTVVARLFGRALDRDGKPVADTIRQEHYVEDRFNVPVEAQTKLAQAFAAAGSNRFRLPDEFSRRLVTHAFLGQIDVNPLGSPAGGSGRLKQCELWGQKVAGAKNGRTQIWVEGRSEVAGDQDDSRLGRRSDGRLWEHEVQLTWEGLIEVEGKRTRRLLLLARGSEKLKWGNQSWNLKAERDVAHLPAGHPIDLSGGVRYGIIGEPVAPDQAAAAAEGEAPAPAAASAAQVPDEARKQLVEALGGPFIVFRDKVQEELKLSEEQKQKLLEKFSDHVQETMKVFEKIKDLKPREREKEIQEHRRKSDQKLSADLKDLLKPKQQDRLLQLQLQQSGAFALLGQHESFLKLKITDEQRKQFMNVVQEMQKKIEPLIKQAESGGNPEEIRPKVMKIRKAHEEKIEAILSDVQKKQWKEMLGKPFDFGD